jgi:hypothetical protein
VDELTTDNQLLQGRRICHEEHVSSKIPLRREQLQDYPGWEIRAPITSDGWYPIVGNDLPTGLDFVRSFKDREVKMVTIIGFSKGGN